MDLDSFYLNKAEPYQGCLLVLRQLILSMDERVLETKKYGMPCFCYVKRPFCYLWTNKKTENPYILFVDGSLLNHPLLEKGSRSKMKIFATNPHEDLPVEVIKELLVLAIDLCR